MQARKANRKHPSNFEIEQRDGGAGRKLGTEARKLGSSEATGGEPMRKNW